MPRGVPNRKTAPAADVDPAVDVDQEEVSAPDPVEPEPETPVAALDVDTTPPPADPAEPDPNPLCRVHFPDGWPEGVTSAGCVDGQWERPTTAGD